MGEGYRSWLLHAGGTHSETPAIFKRNCDWLPQGVNKKGSFLIDPLVVCAGLSTTHCAAGILDAQDDSSHLMAPQGISPGTPDVAAPAPMPMDTAVSALAPSAASAAASTHFDGGDAMDG